MKFTVAVGWGEEGSCATDLGPSENQVIGYPAYHIHTHEFNCLQKCGRSADRDDLDLFMFV